jgi:hypothetical protein
MAEEINFEQELLRLNARDPFEPFTIKLTNGESFEITRTGSFALQPESNTGMVFHPKRGMVFFRKNQIVSVHVIERQEH